MDRKKGYFVFVDGSFLDYFLLLDNAIALKKREQGMTSRRVWIEERIIIE